MKRGWFREAVLPRVTATGKKNILFRLPLGEIRSKFVFLSSNGVGSSHGLKEKQHNKGKRKREEIDGPKAQKDYVQSFNAVDRNDRDSADYSTTIRTVRYYL